MTRATGVLTDSFRRADAWITVRSGALIEINARLGRRFRVRLTENAVLEPPYEPHPGQPIELYIEQDTTGSRTLTVNPAIEELATLSINSAANSISVWRGVYDEDAKRWGFWTVVPFPAIGSHTHSAADIISGTLDDARFSAYLDLVAETKIGTGAAQVAAGDHDHDADYQPLDADLTAIAAVTSAADKLLYATGSGTWALWDFTAFARTLVNDVDAAAARTTLELGTIATKNVIAAQADSTAIDVPGIVSDFNAFLAKARISGALAT